MAMIKLTKSQPRRFTAGLVIALLALSACATANPGEQNDLSRYDRYIFDQIGGG